MLLLAILEEALVEGDAVHTGAGHCECSLWAVVELEVGSGVDVEAREKQWSAV